MWPRSLPKLIEHRARDLLGDGHALQQVDARAGPARLGHRDAVEAYADRDRWLRSAVINTAKAGFFSSDRTIEDYNRLIWHLEPVPHRTDGR